MSLINQNYIYTNAGNSYNQRQIFLPSPVVFILAPLLQPYILKQPIVLCLKLDYRGRKKSENFETKSVTMNCKNKIEMQCKADNLQ